MIPVCCRLKSVSFQVQNFIAVLITIICFLRNFNIYITYQQSLGAQGIRLINQREQAGTGNFFNEYYTETILFVNDYNSWYHLATFTTLYPSDAVHGYTFIMLHQCPVPPPGFTEAEAGTQRPLQPHGTGSPALSETRSSSEDLPGAHSTSFRYHQGH